MKLSKKRNKRMQIFLQRKEKHYCWLEDTYGVASQEVLDLTSRNDAKSFITQILSRWYVSTTLWALSVCPRQIFILCPSTVNLAPYFFSSSTAPWGNTLLIKNGPIHLDLNLPGNKRNLVLNRRTKSPTANWRFSIFWSWYFFIFYS